MLVHNMYIYIAVGRPFTMQRDLEGSIDGDELPETCGDISRVVGFQGVARFQGNTVSLIVKCYMYLICVHCILSDIPAKVNNASYQRDYTANRLVTIWNPLFTLDINDTDPDIVYIVQLFLTTCGQHTLINETTVAGSNATEEDIDLMQTYTAAIFARNNVPGARNGPRVEVEGIVVVHQYVHATYMYMQLIHFITVCYAETFRSLTGPDLFNLARYSQVNIIVRLHVQTCLLLYYVFAMRIIFILYFRVLIQFLPFTKWFWSLLMVMQEIYWSMSQFMETMS